LDDLLVAPPIQPARWIDHCRHCHPAGTGSFSFIFPEEAFIIMQWRGTVEIIMGILLFFIASAVNVSNEIIVVAVVKCIIVIFDMVIQVLRLMRPPY